MIYVFDKILFLYKNSSHVPNTRIENCKSLFLLKKHILLLNAVDYLLYFC